MSCCEVCHDSHVVTYLFLLLSFSDFYVRIFSGMIPRGYFGERIKPGDPEDRRHYDKKVSDIQLEMSLLILRQFDVVMILSEWEQQSVQLQRYGFHDVSLPKHNVNHQKPTESMGEEMKEYLERVNQYDLHFYGAAQEIAMEKTACAKDKEAVHV